MEGFGFIPTDILIPKVSDMSAWSVVACDQFTSERNYWDDVAEITRGKHSTYHLIFPEAYLSDRSAEDAAHEINGEMKKYIDDGVFETLKNSFVYVEREVTTGLRRGLVGAIDLEMYDFSPDSRTPIRASEKTVLERLPARVRIRENAVLELPHIMVLIDDKSGTVFGRISDNIGSYRKIYDFDLMKSGGHIRGFQIPPELTGDVQNALNELSGGDVKIVIGDGNHSLAAAKKVWERVKYSLPEGERENHPARYALVELNNVYDDSVAFEPIHRVVFGADSVKLLDALRSKLCGDDVGHEIEYAVNGEVRGTLSISGGSFGAMVEGLQSAIESYIAENGGSVDYIHDSDSLLKLTEKPDSIGFLLPAMDKSELFRTVEQNGVFPKKSFSIGSARDKRYYLECRKL